MRSSNWKNVERKIAKLLGGKRVPVSGRTRGDSPDIEHEVFSIEVKHRQKFPAWLKSAFDQAIKSIRNDEIPIVILHEKHSKFADAMVVFRLSDLIDNDES